MLPSSKLPPKNNSQMLTSEPPPLAIAQMPAVIQLPPVRVLIEEVETFLALYPDAHRTVNHDARQVVARQQQIARPPPRLRERPSPYSQRHVRRFSAAGENSIPVPNFAPTSPHPLPTRKGAKHLADRSETDLDEDLHAAVTSLIRDIERRNSSDRRIEIDLAFRSQTRPRSPASFIAYLTGHSNPNSPRHAEARAHLQASCFSSSHRIYESKTPIPNSPRCCSAFACVSAPDELPNNKLIFPIDWSHTGLDRTPVWVPATDRVVYFQSTEPSEEDIGVPLFVIEKFPQGMLGGKRDVFRELRQKDEGIQEIRLVLAFDGRTTVTRAVRLACQCGPITRARLGLEIVHAFRHYLKRRIPLPHPAEGHQMPFNPHQYALEKLRLVRITSTDGRDWRLRMVLSGS